MTAILESRQPVRRHRRWHDHRRVVTVLGVAMACAGLLAIEPRAAIAQRDRLDDWRTIANGDEIVALAVNPLEPTELWSGTEGGGVVVWRLGESGSGVSASFRHYLFPNEPGLLSNDVYDIAFDSETGEAWLATGRGVTHATGDSGSGRWTTEIDEPGMPIADEYSAVAVASDGTVWAGTPGQGLAFRTPDGDWTTVDADDLAIDEDEERDGPGSPVVWDIAIDDLDRVWVAHGRQSYATPAVSLFDPGLGGPDEGGWRHLLSAGPRAKPDPDTGEIEGPRTANLTRLAYDEATGDMWLGSWGYGVYRRDPDGIWYEYSSSGSGSGGVGDGPCSDKVWAVAAFEEEVWVACAGSGSTQGAGTARRMSDGTWQRITLSHGLPTNIVTSIALAPSGWAYLGTDSPTVGYSFSGKGIVPVLDDPSGRVIAQPLVTAGIAPHANQITSLLFDSRDRLWVGTRGDGLLRWDGPGAEWERFTRDGTDMALSGDTISDMALRGSELWIASANVVRSGTVHVDGGISVYDLATDTWLRTLRPAPDGTDYGQISSLAVLDDGRVAAGLGSGTGDLGVSTQSGRGVAIYDEAADDWDYWDFFDTAGALSGDTVLDLATDGLELWAALSYFADPRNELRKTGGGVGRLDGSGWTSWGDGDDGLESFSDGLISGDFRSVYLDSRGDVWAGTFDADTLVGTWPFTDAVVNQWAPRRGWEAHRFSSLGWVPSIVEDTAGDIWVATTRGHLQETWPARGVPSLDSSETYDYVEGGAQVFGPAGWEDVTPRNSGLAFKAVRAMAIEPSTGYVWLGGESGGLSVFEVGIPTGPTRTPRATYTPGPSPTPLPTNTPGPSPTGSPTTAVTDTPPAFVTLPPGTSDAEPGPIDGSSTPGAVQPTPDPDEPEPPPEVPEASTWLLLLVGTGALAWWWRRRTRAFAAEA